MIKYGHIISNLSIHLNANTLLPMEPFPLTAAFQADLYSVVLKTFQSQQTISNIIAKIISI